jgi:hypothetical protein
LTASEAGPEPGVVEVSLFGPGCGEAIAVHLGGGSWMLVDSCFDGEERPATLAYLERIGADLSRVELIVCTHWHDDHIGGLGELIESCPEAAFAYSGAIRNDEFFALVGAYAERSKIIRNGVSEFARISQFFEKSTERIPKLALENRRLIAREADKPRVTVDALSPCDIAVKRSQRAIASLLPQLNTQKRAVPPPLHNHASVALAVRVGEARVLLGADLEETKDERSGWTAVLENCELPKPIPVFKVPHHGSENGDQPRLWDEALSESPWALVAPFVWGRHKLPRESDRERIRSHTERAYLSAPCERTRRKRARAVEKTLEQLGATPVNADPPMGQVRLRTRVDEPEDWSVELFGPAFRF